MAAPYRVVVSTDALRVFLAKSRFPLSQPENVAKLGQAIRRAAEIVRARAVHNVSGYPVSFEGGVFRVRVITGALKGSIEVEHPHGGTVLQARVFVNGMHIREEEVPGLARMRLTRVSDYAWAIEAGHKEIDLKQHMRGKTVPFFASKAKAPRGSAGPFTARGLTPVTPGETDFGSFHENEALNAKLAAKGKRPMHFEKKGAKSAYEGGKKGGGAYYIAFRKVGDEGWIIPEAKPRPFMRAAAVGTRDRVRLSLVRDTQQIVREHYAR